MNDFIFEAIAQGGYIGILLLMALENIIPPIPSEVIMGIGGVLVARGEMSFWPLMLAGTVGSTAGNYAWYWVGDKWGYQRLGRIVDRHGRWLTVDFEHIEKAANFFQKHGQWVVFALRFSPFLRTIVSLPAGLAHMPVWRFLLFTFAGSAIWNAILVEGGRRLAPLIEKYESWASWSVIGLIALMLVWYIWRVITWTPREKKDD
ncbi:membrane protein DedA with SNARE-associated domain [Altererythrobacter atlanticus]|uniref:Inner membrane protein YqjA n=1 Tax=Croceibacterium atlanticum TaxID=1267766 RepID=A0A0F7KR52_9SPHN|nr:DedA family protein [Croceibacterium atlanticum]AKH41571.1 Inner membrane protein YqjA [Croceibacterium atlanticum]MBB5733033.1 membrane protein DedA with SNARE-associated domain [Croceibacterium atlanticum]